MMKPRELHTLFSDKEQSLLVSTEANRLKELDEDELDALLLLVRRERNKYTKLYRRQSADLVRASSTRAGTSTSNQRTKRKAEIFEDALARVARALSVAARTTANELKAERLAAARAASGSPRRETSGSTAATTLNDQKGAGKGSVPGGAATKSRRSSTKSSGKRRQAGRDAR
jgi:hypothetical protein